MSTILKLWGSGRTALIAACRSSLRLEMNIVLTSFILLNSMVLAPSQAADSPEAGSSTSTPAPTIPASSSAAAPGSASTSASGSSASCMTADQTDPTKAVSPTGPPAPPSSDAPTSEPSASPNIVPNPSLPASKTTPPTVAPLPNPSGKPQIALQVPSHKLLLRYIRMRPYAAMDRIKSLSNRVKRQLEAGGMDPNIDFDTATQYGKPVLSIYIRPSAYGDNALSKGFKVEASLCQYVRKPSGRVDLLGFQKIGESAEIYSPADFENKAANLVELYLTMRAQHIREAKKAKPPSAKKKTK